MALLCTKFFFATYIHYFLSPHRSPCLHTTVSECNAAAAWRTQYGPSFAEVCEGVLKLNKETSTNRKQDRYLFFFSPVDAITVDHSRCSFNRFWAVRRGLPSHSKANSIFPYSAPRKNQDTVAKVNGGIAFKLQRQM